MSSLGKVPSVIKVSSEIALKTPWWPVFWNFLGACSSLSSLGVPTGFTSFLIFHCWFVHWIHIQCLFLKYKIEIHHLSSSGQMWQKIFNSSSSRVFWIWLTKDKNSNNVVTWKKTLPGSDILNIFSGTVWRWNEFTYLGELSCNLWEIGRWESYRAIGFCFRRWRWTRKGPSGETKNWYSRKFSWQRTWVL